MGGAGPWQASALVRSQLVEWRSTGETIVVFPARRLNPPYLKTGGKIKTERG